MTYSRSVEPITEFKTRSAALIRLARDSGRPVVITQNGRATAVLQDIESFERQRQALLFLKFLARSEGDVRHGRTVSHAAAKAHFARQLRKLRRG